MASARLPTTADDGGRHLDLGGGQPLGDHRGPARVGHQVGEHLDTLAAAVTSPTGSSTSSSHRSPDPVGGCCAPALAQLVSS